MITENRRHTSATPGGIGASVSNIEAMDKVRGRFVYANDLTRAGMLYGATLRSPYPHARIEAIDTQVARRLPGVQAVLTHADIPGRPTYGFEEPDQPVLAWDRVRYQGEPVAIVAAESAETAQAALQAITVRYVRLEPLTDPKRVASGEGAYLHPQGNTLRRLPIVWGNPQMQAPVVVRQSYSVAMQDPAFLAPEAGLAQSDGEGGIEVWAASQWLHADRAQIAAALALPEERVHLHLAGVGGAFGGREDITLQIHLALLAQATGRPVKMSYTREESFLAHAHRHPAQMWYEHGADLDGTLRYVRAHILLDGGAYASSSNAVVVNAATFACGPYRVPNGSIEAEVVFTNHPIAGAMRGFGAVQVAFAYEAQMDRLAQALGMDPVELRRKNALRTGDVLPTGQRLEGPVPVDRLLERLQEVPLPQSASAGFPGVHRGMGFAVAFKNIGYSSGMDDTATVRLRMQTGEDGSPEVHLWSAAAEVGQGIRTVQRQILTEEFGNLRIVLEPIATDVASAGSTSASRQTWMTAAALKEACAALREVLWERAEKELGVQEGAGRLVIREGMLWRTCETELPAQEEPHVSLKSLLRETPVEVERTYHHRPTQPLDPQTGQGNAHLDFAFVAHRAVVDVDLGSGSIRPVELATIQEVGRAVNPKMVSGQMEGGSAQGLGLALMEALESKEGVVQNASFESYLVPTSEDVPPIYTELLEESDPSAPYGLKGVGEMPTLSSGPAITAAVRAASGRALTRFPIRPEDLLLPQPNVAVFLTPTQEQEAESLPMEQINAMTEEHFVATLGFAVEESPWVARAVFQRRPFPDPQALADAFREVLISASPKRQRAILMAHPELATARNATVGLSALSRSEQAQGGFSTLDDGALSWWRRFNHLYRIKFGFPYVFALRAHAEEDRVSVARARLRNAPAIELACAIEEVSQIARTRILDRVGGLQSVMEREA